MTGSSVSEFLLQNQEPTPIVPQIFCRFIGQQSGNHLGISDRRRRKVCSGFPFDRADLLCDIDLLLVRKYRFIYNYLSIDISETWQSILINE